jgi:hypothetical protein
VSSKSGAGQRSHFEKKTAGAVLAVSADGEQHQWTWLDEEQLRKKVRERAKVKEKEKAAKKAKKSKK